jgi:GTP-binding protein Era
MSKTSRSGYIALVGRPNVGKSTLLNQILGQKISITSAKPQTTRHRVLGINTLDESQLIYVDTPGIHHNAQKAMNRLMNKSAKYAIHDVDLIVFLVDALIWKEDDELVLEALKKSKIPVILAINKVDTLKDKTTLLPVINKLKDKLDFFEIIPLSAKTGFNVEALESILRQSIPEGPHYFQDDQVTDRSERFMVSEFIREKIFRLTGQELPYSVTVEVEDMKEEKGITRIHALILVDKEAHKRMIIGNKGDKLKVIGQKAREEIEKMLNKKVYLALWIKVKQGWSDDERTLKQLGYGD